MKILSLIKIAFFNFKVSRARQAFQMFLDSEQSNYNDFSISYHKGIRQFNFIKPICLIFYLKLVSRDTLGMR